MNNPWLRGQPRAPRAPRAFTLIELLIVLSIVSLISIAFGTFTMKMLHGEAIVSARLDAQTSLTTAWSALARDSAVASRATILGDSTSAADSTATSTLLRFVLAPGGGPGGGERVVEYRVRDGGLRRRMEGGAETLLVEPVSRFHVHAKDGILTVRLQGDRTRTGRTVRIDDRMSFDLPATTSAGAGHAAVGGGRAQ